MGFWGVWGDFGVCLVDFVVRVAWNDTDEWKYWFSCDDKTNSDSIR